MTQPQTLTRFEVRRDDLSDTRIRELETPPLAEGAIRLKVDAFAYTANNITYGIAGDRLGYWQFFPSEGPWGVLPVWGFGYVVESDCAGVAVGTRVFGYFPPATHMDMIPAKVGNGGFLDASEHRRALPAGYNMYRVAEPAAALEDAERMLLFPLFITSWALHDSLIEANWHGIAKEGQVVVLSASSKTALGLGHALAGNADAPTTIGLTSPARVEGVRALGLYDEVRGYDEVETLPQRPTVVVDMSGNSAVLNALAEHLGDQLVFISRVGITHWDEAAEDLPRVRETSKMFFAPGHIAGRIGQWGSAEFNARTTAFLETASKASRDWLEVAELDGLGALSGVHEDVLQGRRDAREGLVIRL